MGIIIGKFCKNLKWKKFKRCLVTLPDYLTLSGPATFTDLELVYNSVNHRKNMGAQIILHIGTQVEFARWDATDIPVFISQFPCAYKLPQCSWSPVYLCLFLTLLWIECSVSLVVSLTNQFNKILEMLTLHLYESHDFNYLIKLSCNSCSTAAHECKMGNAFES